MLAEYTNNRAGTNTILQEVLKMNIGVTEISPREVQRKAEKCFKDGYYCCEALVSTIRDEFKLDVPKEVVAMASGMAVGAGKPGCVCGAFNGGILALGMFFGRTEQDGPDLSGRPSLISMNNAVRHCFGDRCLHVCHFLQNRIHLRHKRSHCHPCKSLILRSAVKNYFHLVKIFHYIIPSS